MDRDNSCIPNASASTNPNTLGAWAFPMLKYTIKLRYLTKCRLKIPLATYEYLFPGLSTQSWRKQGAHFSTSDLTEQDTMDRYKIFQIKHYSASNKNSPIALPQILWNYLIDKYPAKHKGISIFYKFSTPLYMQSKIPNMVKWEQKLQNNSPYINGI